MSHQQLFEEALAADLSDYWVKTQEWSKHPRVLLDCLAAEDPWVPDVSALSQGIWGHARFLPAVFCKVPAESPLVRALVILALRLYSEHQADSLLRVLTREMTGDMSSSLAGHSQFLLDTAKEKGLINDGFVAALGTGSDSIEPLEYSVENGSPIFVSPMLNYLWGVRDDFLTKFVDDGFDQLLFVLAKFKPRVVRAWSGFSGADIERHAYVWTNIAKATDSFDEHILELMDGALSGDHEFCYKVYGALSQREPVKYRENFAKMLRSSKLRFLPIDSEVVCEELGVEALEIYESILNNAQDITDYWHCGGVFEYAMTHLEEGGLTLIQKLADTGNRGLQSFVLRRVIGGLSEQDYPIVAPILREMMVVRPGDTDGQGMSVLRQLSEELTALMDAEIWGLLQEKSKQVREVAVEVLSEDFSEETLEKTKEVLRAKKADARLGAVELLIAVGEASIPTLQEAYGEEKSLKVQRVVENALAGFGAVINEESEELSIADLFAEIEKDKRVKLPVVSWFDFSTFTLVQKTGEPLPEKVAVFFVQKQSKHKGIEAAPANFPILDCLEREGNADVALALVEKFLDSDQEAKDRWALTFGGLLGDNRIITALAPRVQPWCEASRHKLAEYAAQAIALLGTEEALMILDTLANRYRSKFKNIGKACREAFQKAAEIRGVSEDELGDLVVPDLGFNAEGHKEFDEGRIIAVLQPDFKISWLNPETDKETKSPPSTLSDEGKAELKALRKILRETVKSQNARFEQMLVRQRRWPVARWQELFEEHPLLQSYASSLVWGIYDDEGTLLRTFRRYPNGILAHGSGEMEDLEERDAMIGMVHPLSLDEESLSVWRDHLGRFKVKPPFAQIDRPVELVEEGHGNRREIGITDGISMSYGTFNGRTNRLGWIRGSVVDAGGVRSYYKQFHGAGVEAILLLEECWVGMDPMDEVGIGKAFFAKIESIERGSYIYDDPEPDDKRVLPFGEVPSIVYSETIADLRAITAGKS